MRNSGSEARRGAGGLQQLVVGPGPLGVFSTDNHPAGAYLFLSAGSGITPLMSMTRTLHGCGSPADDVFVHSAPTPADIIFRRELEALDAADPNLRVTFVCESDSTDEPWAGRRGRLTLPMLLDVVPDLTEREVFTCGPAPYMTAVRALFQQAGADPRRCHEESFVLADPPAPVATTHDDAAASYSVELTRTGRRFACDTGTTILAAAARAGLSLPSSCAEGVCGTCKSTLLRGSVDMHHAGGIRPREIAANQILLCCSTPREDLALDA